MIIQNGFLLRAVTGILILSAPVNSWASAGKEWTIPLTQLGYQKPERRFLHPVRAVFLNKNRIAVSFPVPNQTIALTRRSEGTGGAYLFKTVFIDVGTQKIDSERIWGTFAALNALIPVNNRVFLLKDTSHLHLYSLDLKLIAEKELSAAGRLFVHVSISGKRLYIVSLTKTGSDVEVLDADNLNTVGNFVIPEAHRWNATATDKGLLYQPELGKPTLLLRTYENTAEPVTLEPSIRCIGSPVFISESRFTVSTGCHSVDTIESSGRVVQSIPLGKKSLGLVLPAPEAGRFCADVHRTTGGSDFLDIPPHITDESLMCFDSTSLRQFCNIPLPSKDIGSLSLTISPDASKAAFIDGEALKIIDLPGE